MVSRDHDLTSGSALENEMVERAARAAMDAAAASSAYVQFNDPSEDLSDVTVDGLVDFRRVVRAVMEAMREPIEAQYEALSATDKMWRELDSKTVWQTYIDAALKDHPHG